MLDLSKLQPINIPYTSDPVARRTQLTTNFLIAYRDLGVERARQAIAPQIAAAGWEAPLWQASWAEAEQLYFASTASSSSGGAPAKSPGGTFSSAKVGSWIAIVLVVAVLLVVAVKR